jgi:hypothetical protein
LRGRSRYSILDPLGLTTEVWAKNATDSLTNNIVDLYHVFVDGDVVFATAGVGGCKGGTCSGPGDDMSKVGCYRPAIGRSNFPLGPFDYVLNDLNASSLPSNSHEYAKVIVDPRTNATNLYGQFLGSRPPPGYSLPKGFQAIPVPNTGALNADFFGLTPSPCSGNQPSPDWGERAGRCIKSCGQLGGQASYVDPCYNHGRLDVGVAYDTPFCCGAEVQCGDRDHPSPDWGIKDGICLKSCGGVAGPAASGSTKACALSNLVDAGKSYDAPYCCKPAPCPQK